MPRSGRSAPEPDDDPTQQLRWARDRRASETAPLPVVGVPAGANDDVTEPEADEELAARLGRGRTVRALPIVAAVLIGGALALGGLAAAGVAPVRQLFGSAGGTGSPSSSATQAARPGPSSASSSPSSGAAHPTAAPTSPSRVGPPPGGRGRPAGPRSGAPTPPVPPADGGRPAPPSLP